MIHYTKAYIKELLDKYMDGISTIEEEDILSDYFRGNDVPQEWEDYRQLFQDIEAMKPRPKATGRRISGNETNRRWMGWSVAVAVVAGILYLTIPKSQTETPQPLVAERLRVGGHSPGMADTTTVQSSERLMPDTMPRYEEKAQPVQTKKRRLRKVKPTIHDIDKAYALMAEAEDAQREAERQIEQAQQEIIEAQLASQGYIPVMQEDGTILYIKEQTNYIAYEE